MANATKYQFRVVQDWMGADCIPHIYPVAASQTITKGDPVTLDAAGRVIIATAAQTTYFLGIANHDSASEAVGTDIEVYDDPNLVMEAMVSTGALADTYTTYSAASAFDLAGTTGAFYVNAAASAQDIFKCVGTSKDPVTGTDSAVGANQMKYWKWNPGVHVYGTIA